MKHYLYAGTRFEFTLTRGGDRFGGFAVPRQLGAHILAMTKL